MGLVDTLRRWFGSKNAPDERRGEHEGERDVEPVEVSESLDASESSTSIEPPKEPERTEVDPLGDIARMPLGDGIRRAIVLLEQSRSRSQAMALLRWLRDVSMLEHAPATARIELADFFASRAEGDVSERVLRSVAGGTVADAPPALMRLGDHAAASGDEGAAARCYESVLAIDLEYPGARERHGRLRRGPKAGEAGATLLAPNATVGVGRFELVRELGRGSAGAVFQARDKRLGRQVALKLYHPQARSDRNARLRGEALVAAAVSGSGVVRVYDLFEDVGALVMEFASGGSIRASLAKGSVTPVAARAWLLDVADALAHTHDRLWVHRDLKPGNVLLRADGRAVLTDFGLARRAGVVCVSVEGTVGYMAPEMRAGDPADPRVDVFAFGVLAQELVGGQDPALDALVEEAMARDPEKRLRDGSAVLDRLMKL